jgi:hypothetical protein
MKNIPAARQTPAMIGTARRIAEVPVRLMVKEPVV